MPDKSMVSRVMFVEVKEMYSKKLSRNIVHKKYVYIKVCLFNVQQQKKSTKIGFIYCTQETCTKLFTYT